MFFILCQPRKAALSVASVVLVMVCGVMFPAQAQAQAVTLSPTSLGWYNTAIGTYTGAKTVTVTNAQSIALTISSIAVGSNFVESASTCPISPSTMAAGASCTVSVEFRPLSQGTLSASLTIDDDAAGSPQTAPLSGAGVVGPILFSPTSLTFSGVAAGSVSPTQTATLTNTASSALAIGISKWGLFNETNNCPSSLASQASCTVSVTFNPTSNGTFSGAVAVKYGTSSDDLFLGGTTESGSTGGVTLTPTSSSYGSEQVGSTSSAYTFTLINGNSTPLTISSAGTNLSDYSTSTNCPLSPNTLATKSSCDILVSFDPTTTGTRNATLTVSHNAAGSPATASLTGTGTTSAPSTPVAFSPASLSFANTYIGTPSGAKSVSITNGQSVALNISSIAVSSNFVESANNCPISPSTLAAGASCTVSVKFEPLSQGSLSGTISVTDNASGSPQSVPLSGVGTVGPFLYSPTSLTFGTTTPGTASAAQTATLTNTTSSAQTIRNLSQWGQFDETSNCPSTLAATASCTVSVTFHPTNTALQTGAVQVNYATYSGDDLFLTGNDAASGSGGGGGSGGSVTLTPTSSSFGSEQVGTRSSAQTFSLTNGDSTALTIASVSTSLSDFTSSTNCPLSPNTLASQASCGISVTFDPTTAGTRSGTLTVNHNATGSPATATLTGTGTTSGSGGGVLVLSTSSLDFGGEPLTQPSAPQTITIANQSSSPDTIKSIGVSNASYTQTNTCIGTLAPNATCGVSVTFDPQTTGTITGSVSVASSGSSTAQYVYLSGSVASCTSFAIYPNATYVLSGTSQSYQAQLCGVPQGDIKYYVDNVLGGNTSVGTIDQSGSYTAPNSVSYHTIEAVSSVGATATAGVHVYNQLVVDFGGRSVHTNPISADIMGANHIEWVGSTGAQQIADIGLNTSRTMSNQATVFATSLTAPNWSSIDSSMGTLKTLGMHTILEMEGSPGWLQTNPNICGQSGDIYSPPGNMQEWAKMLALYVAHMDSNFPGIVSAYEIWNEPNGRNMCGASNTQKLNTYIQMYAAAAPAMKAQAGLDGTNILVGGPGLAGLDTTWLGQLITNSSTAPYVDFVSYHEYMLNQPNINAQFNTYYDGQPSLAQETQQVGPGPESTYERALIAMQSSKTPLGAKTPIYIDEYNSQSAFQPDCCRNNPVYSPVWNSMFVTDLLDVVYGSSYQVPEKLLYYAGSVAPFCLVGEIDAAMDCAYPWSDQALSEPYPQYSFYQLLADPAHLDIQSGGFMAGNVYPYPSGSELLITGFYTPNKDSVLLTNQSGTAYNNVQISLKNIGYNSPTATVYEINNAVMSEYSLTLAPAGVDSYTGTINVPAYAVIGITVQ